MLQFVNVSKTYPYEEFSLLDDLSFTVREKEVLGLAFVSGQGKTTVAKLIAGLQKETTGSILLDGKPIEQTPPQMRGIAVIYDDFALMKRKKHWVNAAYTLKIRGVKKDARKAAALAALEKFNLGSKAEMRTSKKTPDADKLAVALSRASLRDFRLVVFDDIFKTVNYDEARKLTALLTDGRDAAQIYLSSRLEDLAFCGRIVVVHDGKTVFDGNPDEAQKFTDGCMIHL